MHVLSHVSLEHDAVLREYVERLYALSDHLCPDCLDTPGVLAELAELQELEQALREMLVPHMDAVEAAVYPTLERIMNDREASAPMRLEHVEIRRLVECIGAIVDCADTKLDRGSVLALRRVMLRLHTLLRAHVDEEERHLPMIEGQLTAEGGAALGRALNHVAAPHL